MPISIKIGILTCCAIALFFNHPALIADNAEGAAHKVEVKNGWVYVDGEKFFVKGVVYEGWRPNQSPDRLERISPELVENDFRLIKEAGFNTIRTAGGLTPEIIASAKRHGLMVMHGIWFDKDIDYRDPDKINYAAGMVRENVEWAKDFDNIITYLVMNEPPAERVNASGKVGTENFLNKIKEAAKSKDPYTPVSISSWIPVAFLDYSCWDVVCFNAYIYSPLAIAYSLGYQSYIEWLKQEKARGKPLIITEAGISVSRKSLGEYEPGFYKYGGNTLEEQKEAVLRMYDDIIEADAQGACIHEWIDAWWRPGNPSGHEDHPEEWYGILGIDGQKSDPRGTPRPVYYALKEYNQAIVIEPKKLRFYRGEIPVEIYATENVSLIQYRINRGKWVDLTKEGRSWWRIRIDSTREEDGKQAFEIRALDKSKNILSSKKIDLWLVNKTEPLLFTKVEIAIDKNEYAVKEKMRIKIRVTDADHKAVPNQMVYYSFFQPVGWSEYKNKKITDANGEINTQFSTFTPGCIVVCAGIIYKNGDFEKRLGDIKIALVR